MAGALADRPVQRATVGVRARVEAYAELSKFGIVLLVLVSAGAGFMLVAPLGAEFPWRAGFAVLLGVMLLSCGASALNQVQERRRDALMAAPRAARCRRAACRSSRAPPSRPSPACGRGRAVARHRPHRGVLGIVAAAFYNGLYTPGSSRPRRSPPCRARCPARSRR
jgi:protoheme IX farnesyltransferase